MKTSSLRLASLLGLFTILCGHAKAAESLEEAFKKMDAELDVTRGRKAGDLDTAFELVDLSRARNMATRIVNALDALSRRAVSETEQIAVLQSKHEALKARIQELMRDRAAALDEYRSGLFCSGCKATKSQILAKGERFPHSGQQIIAATPEQIREKEAELTVPIDKLAAALAEGQAQVAESERVIGEVVAQLKFGISLWATASTYEENLLAARVSKRMHAASAANKKLARSLALAKESKTLERASADEELTRALTAESNEKVSQDAYRDFARATLAAVKKTRAQEEAAISESINREPLPRYGSLQTIFTRASTGAGDLELGTPFRMGSIPAFGQTGSLESVDEFIAEFRKAGSSWEGDWRGWLRNE